MATVYRTDSLLPFPRQEALSTSTHTSSVAKEPRSLVDGLVAAHMELSRGCRSVCQRIEQAQAEGDQHTAELLSRCLIVILDGAIDGIAALTPKQAN